MHSLAQPSRCFSLFAYAILTLRLNIKLFFFLLVPYRIVYEIRYESIDPSDNCCTGYFISTILIKLRPIFVASPFLFLFIFPLFFIVSMKMKKNIYIFIRFKSLHTFRPPFQFQFHFFPADGRSIDSLTCDSVVII